MLKSIVVRSVTFCARHAWSVVIVAALLTVVSGIYAAKHFAITTNINNLISKDLPFRQREIAFDEAFPNRSTTILIVLDAPTPELIDQAADRLVDRLKAHPDLFHGIRPLGSGPFFERNGLLFLPTSEVGQISDELSRADPIIGTLAADPSLRGSLDALSFGIMGVQRGELKLDQLVWPLTNLSNTLDDIVANRPASFSWRVLASGKPAEQRDVQRLIEVEPVLDFSALEPGAAASDIIRQEAADLKLSSEFQTRIRLTGPIALANEEFGTIKEGALLNHVLTVAAVLLILWLALKSTRIILAVSLSLLAGLAVTAALGLLMIGAYNLISIAFAVLFVGLGVDFGLQFSVRYRAERHD
ncbi:MAG TPA: MMPL family transporter, partial [Xanthobacteraceae bacterium]|nr:MMPL family transporter [Xanthobacteraceae bacterium]